MTPASLENQRVILLELLLSHPDPDSFKRVAQVREKNLKYLSHLAADVLKILMKRLLFSLHGLYGGATAVPVGIGLVPGQADPMWDVLLDVLSELDTVALALSTALIRTS